MEDNRPKCPNCGNTMDILFNKEYYCKICAREEIKRNKEGNSGSNKPVEWSSICRSKKVFTDDDSSNW